MGETTKFHQREREILLALAEDAILLLHSGNGGITVVADGVLSMGLAMLRRHANTAIAAMLAGKAWRLLTDLAGVLGVAEEAEADDDDDYHQARSKIKN